MGGVGAAAFDEMQRRYGEVVIGIDFCSDTIKAHCRLGRHVVHGDASDSDFWERIEPSRSLLELVMMVPAPKRSA